MENKNNKQLQDGIQTNIELQSLILKYKDGGVKLIPPKKTDEK